MKNNKATQISKKLLEEIIEALENIRGWGSVEIFVQDSRIVQIIERNIKKTQSQINKNANSVSRAK
ncbi:YezD family protein [Patescibacteria group bacterium]|nr:YezD family protein [Patescibacteria group bacterium]MBU4098973.1 YezD family protein [Patescibacteria group bacterium]